MRQEVEGAAAPAVEGVSAPVEPQKSEVATDKSQVQISGATKVEQSASRHDARAQVNAEAEAKAYIYHKESTTRTNAINKESGACGLGQAWPCSKLPCSLSDYACQDKWFTNYAKTRYGGWVEAKQWWDNHHWW